MSPLEKLPVEILDQVAGYLAFFDKKALSTTSKDLHVLLGLIRCPDELAWIIHLCRSPPTSLADPLLQRPKDVMEILTKTSRKLIYDAHWDASDVVQTWSYSRDVGRSNVTRFPIEPLLLPYFDEAFPKSTVVHFYFRCIHNYAAAAILVSEGASSRRTMWAAMNRCWRRVERESRLDLEWLARRTPDAKYSGSR
ncbi:hypothetical protein IMSHALPRED_001338 [Imshaugia aleurites]|uniref:F-box domain-containing protein n=1 Tax=Imshaugia aleurites TaxID=172621 RepID=A0A8H3J2K3_9LECA|nr:hypothetical protein IMSHALPRED_001338 [Imshaugia aleurites]